MEPPTYLANLYPHERDSHITFDEGPHIYTIDGDSDFMSVTTWNHSHFGHFDADKIIEKMMKSHKWTQSKYYGMSRKEIKDLWAKNGKEASEAGTKMHYDIECFYNDLDVEIEEDCVEWDYFELFENTIGRDMRPYRTEWMVWDKELKFAGSIDMVFENPDGTLQIYDWKRCKEIKKNNRWQSATTACISHLPDCNFWHYSLQLNTYKYMLEKNYGKKVTKMYLVCLHPNNSNRSFLRYEVAPMAQEIEDLMNIRREMLSKL
jgi:ATP-dependent exoDNAse (exonuclease V) beta subunit